MAEKKDPGRFTIRFNSEDPKQSKVIELLNQQGRLKAQFLAGAVLHYINCTETPGFQPTPALDREEIEKIVLSVLERRGRPPAPASEKAGTITVAEPAPPQPGELSDDLADLLGPDGVAAIMNTVAAFQKE